MSTHELSRRVPNLSYARGPQHTLKAELRRMERRGEVAVDWRRATVSRAGVLAAPYVRLKSRGAVTRTRAIRLTVFGVSAPMFLAAVAWLVWESRFVIGAGAALALLTLLYVTKAHGCPGHHCAGCRG